MMKMEIHAVKLDGEYTVQLFSIFIASLIYKLVEQRPALEKITTILSIYDVNTLMKVNNSQ